MNAVFAGVLAATVWMAPNGNDETGDGSAAKPVATLQKAVSLTRQILSDEDKKIVVKDGLYRFDETAVLESGDSWLAIEAEHRGKAVFTGARAVTGWKPDPKDARFLVADFPFKAKDGWTYSFAANGKRATFSCFPQGVGRKTLPYIAGEVDIPKNNRRVIRYDRRTLPSMDAFKDLDLTSVKLFVPQEWASVTVFVATNDWERGVLVLAGDTNMPIGQFNQGYKIYNSRVGMTEPGCWMYSIGENRIYYWPREGETAANLKGEVSLLGQIIHLKDAHDVAFRGIVFEGCAKSPKMKELDGSAVGCKILTGDGTTIEDCEFRNMAGCGFACYHAKGVTVRRTYAHHIDNTGIWIYGGDRTLLEDNETAYLRTGLWFYSGATVLRNHVHHTTGCGILSWSSNSLIASNHIHHTMLTLRDGGGLYGSQTNTRFIGNYCHDNGDWPGLYNDEGGQYTTYTGNVFEGDSWPFHMHDNYAITVTNNTFIGRNGMLFSFQGSTHCVFKDNVIRTAMPIETPDELVSCDVWDNEVQMIQSDGSIITNRLAFQKKPLGSAASAQACEMGELSADAKTGKWTSRCFRGGRGVSYCRNREGVNIPGVPGGDVGFGFLGEYLYISGCYEYNKLSPYPGCYNDAGHVWGVNDGVRFLFKDFSVDVFFDGPSRDRRGTFIVSDGSFACDTDYCYTRWGGGAGAGSRRYYLRIPLKRLGVDPKNPFGAKVPMNVIFYNGDHREYKYYATPAKKGFVGSFFGDGYDYLTGVLELLPYVRNNVSFVDLQVGTQGRPDRMPAGMLRDANQCVGINTVARPGDDFRRDGKSGYEATDEFVRGFMIRHRDAKGLPWVQDFLLLPFRGEDPSGNGVFTHHMDKASEFCESGKNPGYYFVKFEGWQLGTGFTASTNCVYGWFNHSSGGVLKICLDTQDGPDGTVTLAEGELKDGVFEGHNRVKGLDGKVRDAYVKIAFGLKPVGVRELRPNGKKGRRQILDFMIRPKQKIFVKAAISSKSLEDARAKFAADDSAKGFYSWSDAAKADWKKFFETISHDGKDAEHRKFYIDRYFEETK